MKKKFTRKEAAGGARAVRFLSKKAQGACYGLGVYEVVCDVIGPEGDVVDYGYRYFIRGTIDLDNLTLEELEKTLEDLADALPKS